MNYENEKIIKKTNGVSALLINTVLMALSIVAFIFSAIGIEGSTSALFPILMVFSIIISFVSSMLYFGVKVIKPNEAVVYTLFGKYYGTIRDEGAYFLNPFVTQIGPKNAQTKTVTTDEVNAVAAQNRYNKKISLKTRALENNIQKINDELGNPVTIGINIIWHVENPTKAVLNVDNYEHFLEIQSDSALRNIVREYPYDTTYPNEESLRNSSNEVADKIGEEIQNKVDIAGIKIIDAKIMHLAYAPEIAAAMLQRQQAKAVVDARQLIVEGAVGMVEMALEKLSEGNIVTLDDERKAAMVSNLLVVLCGNKDAQPIVNSGSLY